MKDILVISASFRCDKQGFTVDEPVWSRVDEAIDCVFEYGGSVTLTSASTDIDIPDRYREFDRIVIEANVERYRFIVFPQEEIVAGKFNYREWWQPGDLPYQGTEEFNDHPWDTRTVCTDIAIAKAFFKDFFDHKGLTDFIIENTLWCGDNPRTRERALNIGQFANP